MKGVLLGRQLFSPIDVASLALFRILFGAIVIWEMLRYFSHDWIVGDYVRPDFFFKYYGFAWVQPWSQTGLTLHFSILGLLGVLIMFGLWYRPAMVAFFVGFTYIFLLDQTQYLNHFYLISIISFLMIFIPAHKAFSFDAVWYPRWRADTVAAWPLWLLRGQLGLVYFFAGVAKFNGDWLRGQPMQMWLSDVTDNAVIDAFLSTPAVGVAAAYVGLGLDLLVFPLLLWKKTRPFAFVAALAFHLSNAYFFQIGIFPWFMIAATALFFAPDWPRRLHIFPRRSTAPGPRGYLAPSAAQQGVIMTLLAVFAVMQVLVPLRHFLYPGNVSWTEEGHRFAWHMLLRNKSGQATFFIVPESGERIAVDPDDYLTPRQRRKMSSRPDMILQFAHFLAHQHETDTGVRPAVTATVKASLNGRPLQDLIDPEVDLAAQARTLGHADWIVPLTTPLSKS